MMINAFTMTSELYHAQFEDSQLNNALNLLAVELLGHGKTRTERSHWTYWDTAEMNLQVLDAMGIEKAFVLGTSQGGWVTVQMALMRPEKVREHSYAVCSGELIARRLLESFRWGLPWIQSPSTAVKCSVGMAQAL
jgi:pimeloyl-ACP methyl ester carboxylesterase